MSSFDQSKDVKHSTEKVDCGVYNIVVSICSYDGGAKKLQLSKSKSVDGQEKFEKLGRLTKRDLELLIPVMQKKMEELDAPAPQGESQEEIVM